MKRVHTLVWLGGCILAGALGLHYLGGRPGPLKRLGAGDPYMTRFCCGLISGSWSLFLSNTAKNR